MMPTFDPALFAISRSLPAVLVAKVTVVLALGLIATYVGHARSAAVRHTLLAATLGITLLLPIAALIMPPLQVGVPVATNDEPRILSLSTGNPVTASLPLDEHVTLETSFSWNPPSLLLATWATGASLLLVAITLGLSRILSLRRNGRPWQAGQSIAKEVGRDIGLGHHVDILIHQDLSGPISCGVRYPAILLPNDAVMWSREDLHRAFVHELEHVRRRDQVSHVLACVACALYWFHPLAWICWRKLVVESERSCDDAVLRYSDAPSYANQLVELAKRQLKNQRLGALAMADRAGLATRLKAMLDPHQRREPVGARALAAACAAAMTLIGMTSPLTLVAAPQDPPEFDAVSIKLVDPGTGSQHASEHSSAERLTMIASLHRLIVRAYGITDTQLGKEPDWFATRLYSLEAVSSTPATPDQMMRMLRPVLADRFHLKLRQESQELPVFALEVAPGGPKFKELKPGETVRDQEAPPGFYARTFSSVQKLLDALNGVYGGAVKLDKLVVDRTQLTGNYNMPLRTEIETRIDEFGRRVSQLPYLAADLKAQLGLILVSDRTSVPFYIVEQATAPTPN